MTHLWVSNPEQGTRLLVMGNDLADAIRAELRSALLSAYGNLEDAAEPLGIPYKTLRRHLTPSGKDRTARVTLDFVIQVCAHLEKVANVDLAEIYRRAELSTSNVSGSGHDFEQSDMALAAGVVDYQAEEEQDQETT